MKVELAASDEDLEEMKRFVEDISDKWEAGKLNSCECANLQIRLWKKLLEVLYE